MGKKITTIITPICNNIQLCYGPTLFKAVWVHRPEHVQFIMEYLAKLGFNVTLKPIQPRNRLIMKLESFQIYFTQELPAFDPEYKNYHCMMFDIVWAAIESRARFSTRNRREEIQIL